MTVHSNLTNLYQWEKTKKVYTNLNMLSVLRHMQAPIRADGRRDRHDHIRVQSEFLGYFFTL